MVDAGLGYNRHSVSDSTHALLMIINWTDQ